MGKGGAAAILLMVFMAVTSSSSAEYIALSSVLTYDVYKPYLNPTASDKQLLWMGHMFVIGFAVVSSSFAVGLYYAKVDTPLFHFIRCSHRSTAQHGMGP